MVRAGVVYGEVASTLMDLAVTNENLKRGDYLSFRHPAYPHPCTEVLAQVSDIRVREALNMSLALANVNVGPLVGQLRARVTVIGFRDADGNLRVPAAPLVNGSPLDMAEAPLIKTVLHLGRKADGAYIGLLRDHDIPVTLDINNIITRHTAILSRTGSGKSYLVGVLLEEMMKKRVAVVVVDPHGEHASVGQPNDNPVDLERADRFHVTPRGYARRLAVYTTSPDANPEAEPLFFSDKNLDAEDIIFMTDIKMSPKQVSIIYQAMNAMRADGLTEWTLDDIARYVMAVRSIAKHAVVSALHGLRLCGIFERPATRVTDLVRPGQCTVVNMRGSTPEVQILVAYRLLRRLFAERRLEHVPPFLVVLEEAHNFAPQRGPVLSSRAVQAVASEGRKFGMGLCVVTQRPARIEKGVLGQCGTQAILKVTNPNDLSAIAGGIEGFIPGMEDTIQGLPVGSALMTGPDFPFPVVVDIRPRETRHGGTAKVPL